MFLLSFFIFLLSHGANPNIILVCNNHFILFFIINVIVQNCEDGNKTPLLCLWNDIEECESLPSLFRNTQLLLDYNVYIPSSIQNNSDPLLLPYLLILNGDHVPITTLRERRVAIHLASYFGRMKVVEEIIKEEGMEKTLFWKRHNTITFCSFGK